MFRCFLSKHENFIFCCVCEHFVSIRFSCWLSQTWNKSETRKRISFRLFDIAENSVLPRNESFDFLYWILFCFCYYVNEESLCVSIQSSLQDFGEKIHFSCSCTDEWEIDENLIYLIRKFNERKLQSFHWNFPLECRPDI